MRVLFVDDQALFREALAVAAGVRAEIEVVGEAADGAEALQPRRRARAPTSCSWTCTCRCSTGSRPPGGCASSSPAVRVIALTTFDDDEEVFAALRAGAVGYLLKDVSSVRLVEAVLAAARGESVLQPSVAAKVVARVAQLPGRDGAAARRSRWSCRCPSGSSTVLRLLAEGREQPGDRRGAVPGRGHGEEPRHVPDKHR